MGETSAHVLELPHLRETAAMVGRLWAEGKDGVWRDCLYGIYGNGLLCKTIASNCLQQETSPNQRTSVRQDVGKHGLDLSECEAVRNEDQSMFE